MRTLLIFVLLLTCTLLQAQPRTDKAVVTEGAEIPLKNAMVREIIGNDDNGYYVLLNSRQDLMLQRIGRDLRVAATVSVPDKMQYGENKRYYRGIVMLETNIYLLTWATDDAKKNVITFAQQIDNQTLAIRPDLQEINRSPYEKAPALPAIDPSDNLPLLNWDVSLMVLPEYEVAADQSHLLIYRQSGITNTNKKEHVDMQVYDARLQQRWSSSHDLPFDAGMFGIENMEVDHSGNVYLTGIEYKYPAHSRPARPEGKSTDTWHLFSFKAAGSVMRDYPIALDVNFITDVRIAVADNGDLVAAGFYSEKSVYSVKGAFFMTVDGQSGQIKKQKSTAFETDFITQYMSERERNKTTRKAAKGVPAELYEFDLDHLILQNDGGAALIAEQYYIESMLVNSPDPRGTSGPRTDFHYYYNDLLALSFGPDGTLAWKVKVPKRQHSTNDNGHFSSYAYAAVGNHLYLLFNDNPRNMYLRGNDQPYASFGRAMTISVVQIDANSGTQRRELLLTTGRSEMLLCPKICLQTGDRELFIYSERRGRKCRFGRVVFVK
jgi:hypothetical protein